MVTISRPSCRALASRWLGISGSLRLPVEPVDDAAQRRFAAVGLADHLAAGTFEQQAETEADDGVVVGEQDAARRREVHEIGPGRFRVAREDGLGLLTQGAALPTFAEARAVEGKAVSYMATAISAARKGVSAMQAYCWAVTMV